VEGASKCNGMTSVIFLAVDGVVRSCRLSPCVQARSLGASAGVVSRAPVISDSACGGSR
jgi:hypothetical protein